MLVVGSSTPAWSDAGQFEFVVQLAPRCPHGQFPISVELDGVVTTGTIDLVLGAGGGLSATLDADGKQIAMTGKFRAAYGRQVVHVDEPGKLERLARYISRAPFALGKIHILGQDRVRVDTPRDPATGATHVEMDALDFVHRVTTQIPDARRHLIRYSIGAYSHRSRGARRAREEAAAAEAAAARGAAPGAPAALVVEPPPSKSRASWARLIRRIYEVDPLLCPRCKGPLELLAVLVDPKVVDAILRHLDVTDQPTSVHARGPPAA